MASVRARHQRGGGCCGGRPVAMQRERVILTNAFTPAMFCPMPGAGHSFGLESPVGEESHPLAVHKFVERIELDPIHDDIEARAAPEHVAALFTFIS